jgi:hypothetical protein
MPTEYLPCNSTRYIIFSSTWNFLQNRPYFSASGSLNKYKKTEKTLCIPSNHNAIRLEYNNKSNSRK